MFETIAPTYDFQNSFLSLRRDSSWRRALARAVTLDGPGLVLDVAVGTGEVALEICRHHPCARVVGVDFSPAMLAVARKKISGRGFSDRISLLVGDGRRLPIESGHADALTIAFGIRNIEEMDAALAEFQRVLKPGGQLLIMEFSYPEAPVLDKLYRFYFDRILPPVGNLLSRTDYAYSYLSDSVDHFPDDAGFLQLIGRAGFSGMGVRKLTFGIAKIYRGIKR
ncbi:MAG: bifunctional demethylmenaquinone methyltransferase/2-methoxy-6-polyprenyl-1,4-benzoquinol methylase UbiE, partial [Deltaproteobacteria bacterium]